MGRKEGNGQKILTDNSMVETLFWLQTLLLQSKEHHAVSGRNIMSYLGNDVEFGVNTSLLLLLQTKVHYVYRIIMCYLASIPANKVCSLKTNTVWVWYQWKCGRQRLVWVIVPTITSLHDMESAKIADCLEMTPWRSDTAAIYCPDEHVPSRI